jgi:hypothetical protein
VVWWVLLCRLLRWFWWAWVLRVWMWVLVLRLLRLLRALAQGVLLLASAWKVARFLLEILHHASVRLARGPCHSVVW